jgi:Ser/Thr protein kinase RdoA (MazF antagonist)
MLEARADPKHPDHADVVEWLDGYDPEELDVFPIEGALGRIAARRNAAAKRIMKPAHD